MLLLRACPHCHGDLVFERDEAAGYLECVQCGHTLSQAEERALGVRTCFGGIIRLLGPESERSRHATAQSEEPHPLESRPLG